MNTKKFSYATQRNIPCKENAQKWYLFNTIQKYNNTKNPYKKTYYYSIINYYMNGNAGAILS